MSRRRFMLTTLEIVIILFLERKGLSPLPCRGKRPLILQKSLPAFFRSVQIDYFSLIIYGFISLSALMDLLLFFFSKSVMCREGTDERSLFSFSLFWMAEIVEKFALILVIFDILGLDLLLIWYCLSKKLRFWPSCFNEIGGRSGWSHGSNRLH